MNIAKVYRNVVGLTGIMGSGKTTAAKIFRELGVQVIDADSLAKFVLSKDYARSVDILGEIRDTFEAVAHISLFENGTLNRQVLASLVFSDERLLQQLNKIMHPYIEELFLAKVIEYQKVSTQTILYDVPLLFENGLNKLLKEVIVVYVPESVAIERAQKRTGLSKMAIKARLKQQISIEEKKKIADHVLYNTSSVEELRRQIIELMGRI